MDSVHGAIRVEHDRLTAYLNDTSTVGTPERMKVVLTHRALTDFLDGRCTRVDLAKQLARIEAGAA